MTATFRSRQLLDSGTTSYQEESAAAWVGSYGMVALRAIPKSLTYVLFLQPSEWFSKLMYYS